MSRAKPISRLVMSIWTLTALLLPAPAPAATPFLLARDRGQLVLLSPSPLIHVCLPRYYRWEGTASTFEAEYKGADLVLTIHRDWYQTAWWFDLRLVQKPNGEVCASWYSTGNPDDVMFARYPSFRAAWADKRVRRALQPALCQMRQYLPDVDEAWVMIGVGW